jgi:hypothetical protein
MYAIHDLQGVLADVVVAAPVLDERAFGMLAVLVRELPEFGDVFKD